MERCHVDYSDPDLPDSVRNFMPEVYRDGDSYISILGSDPERTIAGEGTTIEEALQSWDNAYQEKSRK